MLRKEPGQTRRVDSEDRLHRALALILGAVAGAVLLTREPEPPHAAPAGPSGTAQASDGPSREALEAAIAELARWFERSRNEPRTTLQANLRLLAMGRAALEPSSGHSGDAALVWENLARLTPAPAPEARPASLPVGGVPVSGGPVSGGPAERDASAFATLAILLETGAALDTELPLGSGAVNARQLLERALAASAAPRDSGDPWTLDLLSFAVLAGFPQRRSELERQTLASLGRLEREQRELTARMGDGAPAAAALQALAAEQRREGADGAGWSRELQLAAAVFRAVAVLAEAELEQRALRHLNVLLFRHQLERDLWQQTLARAHTASERAGARLRALEALGRLEQALYGAHLAFRREDRPGPAPRTASSMRRAAGELIEQLEGLKQEGAFAPGGPRDGLPAEALARAAAHALRGLRAARVAS